MKIMVCPVTIGMRLTPWVLQCLLVLRLWWPGFYANKELP